MGKQPAFQFYTGDWLKDPALSKCSPATRGVFVDALCAMHESDRSGHLQGTADQLARTLRCLPSEVIAAASELEATNAADVTIRNGVITLVNRRMQREHLKRLATRERVAKHRCNDPSSSSTSTSFSPGGENPPYPPLPLALDTPEFREVWIEFAGHRNDLKKPLTTRAAGMLLKELAGWGVARAISATSRSIANGWQGIFEEKVSPPPANGHAPKTDFAAALAVKERK